MDLSSLLDIWHKESAVVKGAPVLSLAILGIGVAVGWWLSRTVHSHHVATLNAHIDALKDRIADYSERLGLVQRDHTAYSKLTNLELKTRTDDFLSKFRQFHAWIAQRERDWMANAMNKTDPAEQKAAFLNSPRDEALVIFKDKFLGEALNLRDELRRRIPPGTSDRVGIIPASVALDFGSLAGSDPVGDAIAHIERLAGLLPLR